MGYGAYMNVVNNRQGAIHLFVTNVNCMYDNGHSGSNLSLFNNALVNGGSQLPGGDGQYIEAKGSDSCFFEDSTFDIKIEDAANSAIIGTASFSDSSEHWNGSSDNKDVIDVYINNSGDQARIVITVEAT